MIRWCLNERAIANRGKMVTLGNKQAVIAAEELISTAGCFCVLRFVIVSGLHLILVGV